MKKIISLFQRNYETDRLVRDEIVPGAEWVINGEGIATRKYDGTCCNVENGVLYKRYDAKNGKIPPNGFRPAQKPDPVTGHWPGWLPVGNGPEDKWFERGLQNTLCDECDGLAYENGTLPDATYELCGPHFQGNPEKFLFDSLIMHGSVKLPDVPRSFEEIKGYLKDLDIEGIVWHRENGDMVKIKKKDFGFKR